MSPPFRPALPIDEASNEERNVNNIPLPDSLPIACVKFVTSWGPAIRSRGADDLAGEGGAGEDPASGATRTLLWCSQ